jgi:uncharacterized protein YbjT (DUF2867 family)
MTNTTSNPAHHHQYSENRESILVIGGHGKTGRRVVERLKEAGRHVRIGSRRAELPFDWEKPGSWSPALRGVTAAYVTYQPDLAVPGALETVRAFFDQALRQGVRRLVLLSGRGEEEAQAAEQALQATEADWTILRASWFAQNFSENFFLDPILAGEVALPVDSVAEPFVDADDIADIAFAALTDSRGAHCRRLYELTGPQAITFADALGEIARATQREIRFIPVSAADYRSEMERQGIPREYIDLVLYLFTTVLDGRNTPVADGVQRALGRAPRSFGDYVRATAAMGVWNVAKVLGS